MTDDGWALVLFRVRPQSIGDGGHDLRPQPYLPPGLVCCAWYMTNQKHGVSALGLQRLLGLGSYQSAWTILQKLRTAMVRPGRDRLRGSVEVDESYVGGIEQGVRGRGTSKKFIVGIAIEVLFPKGFGRVRLRRIRDVSGDSLVPFVCDAVEPGTVVRTDGWSGYNDLPEHGYRHEPIVLSRTGDPAHFFHVGSPWRRFATQTLVARHPPRIGHSRASGCLSQ
jgi:transposase-like protein